MGTFQNRARLRLLAGTLAAMAAGPLLAHDTSGSPPDWAQTRWGEGDELGARRHRTPDVPGRAGREAPRVWMSS